MKQRLTTILSAAALLVAAFAATRQVPAQGPNEKGLFSSLKAGQMVELAYGENDTGYFIRTYDDPAKKSVMVYKVIDIDDDYVTLHIDPAPNPTEIWDIRIPTQSVISIFHVRQAKKK